MKVIYITNPPDSRNIQDRDTRHGEIFIRILWGSITPGFPSETPLFSAMYRG